jgi:hypothetical protein
MEIFKVFLLCALCLFRSVLRAEDWRPSITTSDPDAERLLMGNQHLFRGEGAVMVKRKDGTSMILGVGMATVLEDRAKYTLEAEKHAKLKIIELVKGTNVKTQQRMTSEQSIAVKGGQETASISEKVTEDTQIRTAGSVRNAATVANWMSPDNQTYYVALLQRNETVYLPETTGIRVDLGRGVEWMDFIAPELRSSRSEFPNGERRKKEMLDEIAVEIRDSVLSTLAKQKRYVLTTEKDSASMITEIKTEAFKAKVEGSPSSGRRSVQITIAGMIRLYTESTGQEFFRTTFSAGTSKIPFAKADDFDTALEAARGEILVKLRTSLRFAKCTLMNKLGVTKLVFSEYGSWMLGEGVDAGLLSEGDRVSLWKGEGEDAVKVAECSLAVQSGAMVLSGIQPQGGDIFLFKMESCAEPVQPSKASPEPPAPVQKAGKKRP